MLVSANMELPLSEYNYVFSGTYVAIFPVSDEVDRLTGSSV